MSLSTATATSERSTSPAPDAALMTVDDVAALLAVSPRTVRRMADSGAMPPPVRLASLVRWRLADLDRWLADGCPSCREQRRLSR